MAMTEVLTCVFLVVFLCYGLASGATAAKFKSNGEYGVSENRICSLVETYGYRCEEHTVTTQDGYIVSMQRILVGRSGEAAEAKRAVLLQHGLLMAQSNGLVQVLVLGKVFGLWNG